VTKIHEASQKVCECFGITQKDATGLISSINDDWAKLVSGKEGANFSVCSIYSSIEASDLKENEKCFLCTHVAQSWEIFKIRKMFMDNDVEGFTKEICMW
jgi:predicted phosphoadenosine phosphosulfate sulfurtransferase